MTTNNSGSTTTSPRISFSHDLPQTDTIPVDQKLLRSCSSSNVNFSFCIQAHSDFHTLSMANELFFDGKIIPTPLKSTTAITKTTPLPRNEDKALKRQSWKLFWRFKRNSSCGIGYGQRLCPITLLSRSNLMGSSTSSKQSSLSLKYNQENQKPAVSKKPPPGKSGYGYGNHTTSNGIRVDPILNLSFGSLFYGNNKNKSK